MQPKSKKDILIKAPELHRLFWWFARYFICPTIFSNGHIPEPFLTETDFFIHTKRCKRCKAILGLGTFKGFRDCPPPNSNPEQVKQWEEYYDNNLEQIRQSAKSI